MSKYEPTLTTDFNAIGYDHGYEFADTVGTADDAREWAEEVERLSGCAESDLYEAAYIDFRAAGLSGDYDDRCDYAAAHVRGQKERAREILAEAADEADKD